ncbi:MAG: putative porin [Planctomycetota bacterium]|jgi:hypothetical protein
MRNWLLLVLAPVVLAGLSGALYAQEETAAGESEASTGESEIVKDLLEEMESIQKRLDELEKREPAIDDKVLGWLSRWSFGGDARLRYENTNVEHKPTRNRGRVRLRVRASAEVVDDLKVNFQLASGSEDPLSSNQTLGDFSTTKRIGIDIAEIVWTAMERRRQGLVVKLAGGKMKVPFAVMSESELLWDSDFRPEGAALTLRSNAGPAEFFATLGGFYVEERSGGADSSLWGIQGGFTIPIASKLTVGTGYYDYGNIEDQEPFDEDFFGNSVEETDLDADGDIEVDEGEALFLQDYDLWEWFAEYRTDAGDLPVSVFANYVYNVGADSDEDRGYLVGVKLGKVKKPMSWEFRYIWAVKERDAVFGTFTDSDFGGGGADNKGSEFNAAVGLAKNVKLAASFFLNKTELSEKGRRRYERLQLDLSVKF